MTLLPPTPSQTVGPFFGHALPYEGGGDLVPAGHPGAISVHGYVRDGNGDAVPDALLEFWQPGTGLGRVATGADGHWSVRTAPPPAARPYLPVCVFARGLMHHLFTRAYIGPAAAAGGLLAAVPEERRSTLIARPEGDGTYRFDIRLQGEKETVFLDFHG
ncbi:peptidase associated/transthyretin-like domain-containing protein [Streptomyces wuyuanensis]|uniref:Protocatechuate 3,4-dioxygenase alpha subunit n=1 Tax=Streptomyces wuyuanensis TaxID=1196353 RepID=A0A1G9S178_9ACTN|nr:protocatechuate 3,4-dioxygenase subunit alpha [Streptomyces wuyuanensis]SDM29226.1 protocatechuate 3,4-dioxygenase alpha subunit [Streptomyces wuyuanensis]